MDDAFIRWLMTDEFGLEGLTLPELPAWSIDATCVDADPDAFFPEKGGTATPAKAICARCPVRDECLDYALAMEGDTSHSLRIGVWGGLTPKERARVASSAA